MDHITPHKDMLFEKTIQTDLTGVYYHGSKYWVPSGISFECVGMGDADNEVQVSLMGSHTALWKWWTEEFVENSAEEMTKFLTDVTPIVDEETIAQHHNIVRQNTGALSV